MLNRKESEAKANKVWVEITCMSDRDRVFLNTATGERIRTPHDETAILSPQEAE